MAKLLRIHLVGVGHQEAKFHPLTMDFGCNGQPMDTVLNLRNGGGKTSLLSLIYAVLLPGKIDFLGRVNGSNRSLEQNFIMGKLGVVTLEVETQAGRFGLMMAWVRKERDEPLNLFSFRTDKKGIPFNELPLQGLNSSPVTNLAALSAWLTTRHNEAPANVDLFFTEKFREWHGHLKSERGIDPHLYRAHLQMNKAEGAVDEEFKFTKTNDFIKRYLDFAIEPPAGPQEAEDPVTTSLNEHRLSLTKQPHYRREVDFVDEIVPFLREMDGHAQRKRNAEADKNSTMSELQEFADGVAFLETKFGEEHTKLEAESKEKIAERNDVSQKRDNARRHATGYERRAKELKISEAKTACEEAKTTAEKATGRVRLLSAAELKRKLRRAKTELDALVEQQNLLQQKLRPDFEAVQSRALRLNSAYDVAIEAAQLALGIATEEEQNVTREIKEKRIEYKNLTDENTRLSGERAGINAKIEMANKARNGLVSERIITPREDIVEAEARLQADFTKFDSAAKGLRGQAQECRRKARNHRSEAQRQRPLAVKAEKEAGEAARDLERFKSAVQTCADLEQVRSVLEGGAFDPFNQGVIESLKAQEHNWRDQWSRLNIERAEDQRLVDEYDPQKHPLFPAPREVEDLLAELHKRGIKGIMTAYAWLNANATDKNQAQERLRQNPATFSGLVANTQKDLESSQKAFASFPLSRPITITLSTELETSNDHQGVIVIPERAGLFNAHAALIERTGINEHQSDLEIKAQELDEKARAFAAAANQVQSLLKEFSASGIEQLRQKLSQNESLAQQFRAAERSESEASESADDQADNFDQQGGEQENNAATAKTNLAKVTDYRAAYANRLENWLACEKKLGEDIAANDLKESGIEAKINELEEKLPDIKERKNTANSYVVKHQTNKGNARLAKYLPPNPERVTHGGIESEESPFTTARDAYEDKARDGTELQSRIQSAENSFETAANEFNLASSGLNQIEINVLSEAPDLEIQIPDAQQNAINAKSAKQTAEKELERANADRPKPLGPNERADLDPELPQPETSAEALELKTEKYQLAQQFNEDYEKLRDAASKLESQATTAENKTQQYATMSEMTSPAKLSGPREHSLLTGDPEQDRPRIRDTKTKFEAAKSNLDKLIEKMSRLFDNQIDPLVKDDKWDRLELPIRDRFRKFSRVDYESNAAQYIHDCEERKAGLEAKLKEIEAIRETLVEQLYVRGTKAISLLRHAARVSTLPDGIGAWSNQPFLRVNIPALPTQAERRVLLARLMDSWMAPQKRDMTIPQGAALAYECLIAVMGQREIDIEILKPAADNTIRNYKPVTELAAFSGGQRVTAAILLYCVIVRVRSDHGELVTDCGFLMLDNPFGKANHFPLVDLQLKMANVMGVQLIYLTGINDFEALASFPHRIRLRNSARNAANGELMVQHESNLVEATRLGKIPPHGNAPNP